MSLQVWMSLNGSLNNNGLDDITVSGTASYSTGGKIGSQKLATANTITLTCPSVASKKTWSVCFWGYVVSSSITASWTKILSLGDGGSLLRVEVCPKTTSNGIYCYSLHNNADNKIFNGSISAASGGHYDKWTHICITSDGKTISRYADGKLTGTITYSGDGSLDGKIYLYNNNAIYKNDLRIYDNCLSAREIKEISKGIVLHYPLNQPERNPNLIPNSWTMNGIFSIASCTGEKSIVADPEAAGGYHIECKCTADGTGGFHFPLFTKSTDKIGKTYTWSFYAKCSVYKPSCNMGHECGGTINLPLYTTWTQYKKTWTFTDAQYNSFIFYPGFKTGEILYIKDFKIEEGANSSPQWSPAAADSINWNDNIEYDTSGYGNNGTIAGTFSINSDSPRNSICYNFNGSNYIIGKNIAEAKPIDALTISVWYKTTDITKAQNIVSSYEGGGAGLHTLNSKIYFQIYSNGGYRNIEGSTLSNNTWYHIVGTYDKANLKIYINGSLIKTLAYTYDITYNVSTPWAIACNPSGTKDGGEHVYGCVSDARIYSTALSAEDIKELYNSPVSITKNGTIMGQGEFIEK